MGGIALVNTATGVASALWRFSPNISITFIICTILAATLTILGYNMHTPYSEIPDNQPQPTEQLRQKPPKQGYRRTKGKAK